MVVVWSLQKKTVFFLSEINKVKRETFVWLSNHFGHKSKVVSVTSLQAGYCICSIKQLDCHLPNFAFLASINHSIACNPGTAARHRFIESGCFFWNSGDCSNTREYLEQWAMVFWVPSQISRWFQLFFNTACIICYTKPNFDVPENMVKQVKDTS